MLTCHACRKIPAGAELTFNYGFEDAKGSSIYMSREGRRRRLYYSFGFECSCEKCSLVGAALQQSEQNIAEIGDDKQLLGEMKQRCKADSTQAPVSDWAFLRFTRSLHFSVSPAFSTAELHRMVAVQNLVREPAESNLARLEALYAAMRRESPDGIYSGEECVIQALCEFCEAAAANLIDVLTGVRHQQPWRSSTSKKV